MAALPFALPSMSPRVLLAAPLAAAALAATLGRDAEAAGYWDRALDADPAYFDTRPDERHRWELLVGGLARQQPPAGRGTAVADARTSTRTAEAARRARAALDLAPASSGSGFIISSDGYVLTNKHVVRGCTRLGVRSDSTTSHRADLVAVDEDDDLALLRAKLPGAPVAAFRSGPAVRAGDDVIAVGFPLSGLLANQVNVTTGSVSALAGLYNDTHVLQMSAPVQPGSSGGPLFDASGNVVGVVVTKLNARVVAEETGDIPQNVNFAVKESVVREFLDAQAVKYRVEPSAVARSHADVGEVGRQVTLLVECWR